MSRLREEMKVVPAAAWPLALLLAFAVVVLFWVVSAVPGGMHPAELLIMGLIAVVFSAYVLIISYIFKDARRRGMPVLLWVLLAIFIPSGIGIILYFLLRRPLVRACAQCGAAADTSYAFCPSCGAGLGKTCPSCHSSVEFDWAHCAKCGAALQTA